MLTNYCVSLFLFSKSIREKQWEIQKKKMPHRLSRGGYGKLNYRLCSEEWERLKENARQEGKDEEEIENIPRPKRILWHKLWKVA